MAGAAGSALLGIGFFVERSALGPGTFAYAWIVAAGSLLLGGAAALIVGMSRWPLSRARRRAAAGLLLGTELLIVPLFVDEWSSFAGNAWLMLSLLPYFAYAAAFWWVTRAPGVVLGPSASTALTQVDLGNVTYVTSSWAWVGGPMSSALQGGASSVDVEVCEGGVKVRQARNPARLLVSGDLAFPDIRFRWADIDRVRVSGGAAVHNSALTFTFPEGRGFVLQKSFGIDNLEPVVQALEAHGVRVIGRVVLPFVPYGSRPTRRLVVASICTAVLASLSASPSWLVLGLAPADVRTDPGMLAVYLVTSVALILNIVGVCAFAVPELMGRPAEARRAAAIVGLACFGVTSLVYAVMWLVLLVWWGATPLGGTIATLSGLALLIAPASTIATIVLYVNVVMRLSERARVEASRRGIGPAA